MVLIRSSTLRVCSRTSLPSSPVTGCRPVWPATKTRLPNLVAGERLGFGAASPTRITSFFGISLLPPVHDATRRDMVSTAILSASSSRSGESLDDPTGLSANDPTSPHHDLRRWSLRDRLGPRGGIQ